MSLGYQPDTGTYGQASRTVHGDRSHAEAILAMLVSTASPVPITVGDLLGRWLQRASPRLSPPTRRGYQAYIARYLSPELGDVTVGELQAATIQALYRSMAAERGLAPATVTQTHAILRRALADAMAWGWASSNPAASVAIETGPRPPTSAPTEAAVAAFLDAAQRSDPGLGVFVRLAAATGARRGELCAMRCRDVNWKEHTVHVDGEITSDRGRPVRVSLKAHQIRTLSLDAPTTDTLDAHRRRRQEEVRAVGARLGPDTYLFGDDPAGTRPWPPDRATDAVRRLARRHDLSIPPLDGHLV